MRPTQHPLVSWYQLGGSGCGLQYTGLPPLSPLVSHVLDMNRQGAMPVVIGSVHVSAGGADGGMGGVAGGGDAGDGGGADGEGGGVDGEGGGGDGGGCDGGRQSQLNNPVT